MQDLRWKLLWLGSAAILVSLIIWAATDTTTALLCFCGMLLFYLAGHLYWLHSLLQWFKKPDINTMPMGSGVWEDVFSALYYAKRRNSRSQAQMSSVLDRFRHAASALPDGVVLLNGNDQIEWCNPTAERQLGLSLRQDTGQPISYLVRANEFIHYLQQQDYSEPIKLRSWHIIGTTLEIQIVPFGDNQKLLISRDISQMEKLETMRRDFIANVSHELRTPLTVVGGFLETLLDMDGAVPESTRAYFSMMQEQTGRMRHLIEDLLILSQLENSPQAPQESEIDLSAMLNMLLHEGTSLSQGKHDITLEPMEAGLFIKGAAEELHSAFSNLVSNAVRYTPEGGSIRLKLYAHGREIRFSVQDTGIGIEQQHIDRLTERFYRVDRSRSRETGGTGLGLSIVKHILTRHHGHLEIESEPGEGSTFTAVFPESRLIHKSTPQ